MRCEEVMELIQRNLDDDLSSSESAMMHEHLHSCQECQSLHESLSLLSLELENLPDIEPPISIVDRILPQLEGSNQVGSTSVVHMHQPKTQRGPLLWKRWAVVAGSAAAVLMVWISADHLWTPELDQSKVQMQSASDNTTNSASTPEPKLEGSAQPEVALNRSVDQKPEQEAENKSLLADDRKQPASSSEKVVKEKTEEHAVALESSPDQPNRKAEVDSSKAQATDQQPADQQMALAPQEKAASVEEMPSIAARHVPGEEDNTEPPMALASPESTEMIQAFKAPELSDTNEVASRGEAVYPSPEGEWMAQLDGQTVVIIDHGGMEVFRSHAWPAEMEVKVEWIDEDFVQYTLSPKTMEENSGAAEAETWKINIQERQEQKQ